MCTAVNPFAHFSLAPYVPIGDNPALPHNSGTWADNSGRAARGATGAKQSVPAQTEFRSLKKDADKNAFHSFFTSVEIAEGFLFFFDDNCNSNWAGARITESLGEIP